LEFKILASTQREILRDRDKRNIKVAKDIKKMGSKEVLPQRKFKKQ
jgi:hypothetical protein